MSLPVTTDAGDGGRSGRVAHEWRRGRGRLAVGGPGVAGV